MTKKSKSSYQIDMIHGPLAGKILLFALPLMLSSILQLLFNAADVVVVGRFAGKEALAAVGSTTALVNLLVNLFIGFSVGSNVVVARALGSGRTEDASQGVHTSITLALFSGLGLMAVGGLFSRQMLELMSSPPDVIDLAALYLRIFFCGMPANMLYNFGAAILRAQGDTRRPLYYLSISGILNVVLNLFFVINLHMSVAGVALATIISQYVSAGLVLLTLLRDNGPLHLDLKKLGMNKRVVGSILRVGLPAGFQGVLFALSNVVIQSSINSFNSTIVAGSSASASIEGFAYSSMNAFCQAAMTFASQNYAAGECKRIDRILGLCLTFTISVGLALGVVAHLFGVPLASLYVPGEEEVIAHAVSRLKIISSVFFVCGIMDTMPGILRGLGYSVVPMVVSLVGVCGTRLLWVATIFQIYRTPETLYISYAVSWLVTAIAHLIMFFAIRKRAYSKARNFHAIQTTAEA